MIRLRKLAPTLTLIVGMSLAAALGAAHGGTRGGAPVTTVASSGPGQAMAVFYSGDGGWATVDRSVSADLAAHGVPVVGVDSLRYFRGQSPDEAAADLAGLIDTYGPAWGRGQVVLVGYSFGADALPLIAARLPPAVRARVRAMALIAPGTQGDLTFRPTDWLDIPGPDAQPLAPALAALRPLPVLCIYGASDAHAGCRGLGPGLARPVAMPGGHHLGGDYVGIGRAIRAAL